MQASNASGHQERIVTTGLNIHGQRCTVEDNQHTDDISPHGDG